MGDSGSEEQKNLKLDSTQYLICPMNWNLDGFGNNSLQAFVVLKHEQMTTGTGRYTTPYWIMTTTDGTGL